ncbi:glycosyltransferase [Muricoccus radiodurans]|uniref:glycosyltransferase n=1 Tax=Muricoccus radiodurans TaxID=2231721 RepID=UPI003CF820EF
MPRLVLLWGAERLEIPLRRLRERRDLPARDGLPAGRDFHALLRLGTVEGPISATVQLGGETIPLTPPVLQASAFRPQGGLERADRGGVRGWVLDAPWEQPSLQLEGCDAVPVPLTLHRPDLPFDDGSEEPTFGFDFPLEALAGSLRQAAPGASLFDGRSRELILMASGVELARRTLTLHRDLTGKLERVESGTATGWLAERGRPQDVQTVDLLLDGTRWDTVEANLSRPDLVRAGLTQSKGGFQVLLPRHHPGEGGPLRIAAAPHGVAEPLPGEVVTAPDALPPWRRDHGELAFRMPAEGGAPVSVIVPIHNAAEEFDRCLESVVRHTTGPARLILIDDASTQPEVAQVLRRWRGHPGVEIHQNPENLGFTRTVNRGIVLAGRDDVVLLNSDTAVGPGWLDGLRAAAHSGPRTGTATAVSNNSGAFSVPEINVANEMLPWFGVDEMARLVRQCPAPAFPVVPTGHGFCLYVRRACLDVVGLFDEAAFPRGYGEENDFCMRAARAGFDNVLDDRSFVWHQRSASFGAEKAGLYASGRVILDERYPEYRKLTRMFRSDPAILAVRWRVRRALDRARAGGDTPRPRVLFVVSTQTGGTPLTNRDLMGALSDRYEPWLLSSDSRSLTLSRYRPPSSGSEGKPETVTETHHLERPIEPTSHRSTEYDRAVADLILRHGFELVHIRHLAWHGLGLPEVCRRLNVPVIFSFHDFYTICPTTKLLDAEGRFCGGPCTRGEADCKAELWPADAMPPLRHRYVHRWKEMMGEALSACDAFVTTSHAARATLTRNFPFLEERDFRLIPHGRSFPRMEMLATEPTLDERLRVLVPGNISEAKGGALVAAVAALDGGREIEFHVLGATDRSLAARPGLILHGRYTRDDFAAHVAGIRPHVGVILSRWPETYCHTLTECWAAGVPVVATKTGALAERITEDPGGWLVDPRTTPEELLALLRRLRREPASVRARRDAVLDWQSGAGRHWDAAAMAVEYDRLYREVLGRRLSFRTPQPAPRVLLTLDRSGGVLPTPLRVATRNAVGRSVIFRPVLPSFPFGDPRCGRADGVLVAPGAVPPEDLAALRARCAAAGLPVVELSAGPEEEGLFLGQGLAAADWLSGDPGGAETAPPEPGTPWRVLFAHDGDTALLAALRPVFENLGTLGVATLSVLDGPAEAGSWFRTIESGPAGGIAALRRAARDHDLGLSCSAPMSLALQAACLPVVTIPPDLPARDPAAVQAVQDRLLQVLAEMGADALRHAGQVQADLRAVRRLIADAPAPRRTDAELTRVLDAAAARQRWPGAGPVVRASAAAIA